MQPNVTKICWMFSVGGLASRRQLSRFAEHQRWHDGKTDGWGTSNWTDEQSRNRKENFLTDIQKKYVSPLNRDFKLSWWQ